MSGREMQKDKESKEEKLIERNKEQARNTSNNTDGTGCKPERNKSYIVIQIFKQNSPLTSDNMKRHRTIMENQWGQNKN